MLPPLPRLMTLCTLRKGKMACSLPECGKASPAQLFIPKLVTVLREGYRFADFRADFIAGLNEDEQFALVALVWIGRETFEPEEWDEAVATARDEATAPTEDYLMGIPLLADYLEAGLERMGIDPTEAEDDLG